MGEPALEQHVIPYDKPGETGVIYDTAYTESQMQASILRCRNTHGPKVNVRTILAKRRAKGERR